MKRCFIYQDAKSQKFWNIEIEEMSYTAVYGRLGTAGQVQKKEFDSSEKCAKAAEKVIAEKIKKGYIESSEEVIANTKDEAKRFSLSWEEMDEGKDIMDRVLNYKNLYTLKHMIIANWGEAWDDDEQVDRILEMLMQNKAKFPFLESLHIGDMSYEECEISWIIQGDYSKIWTEFPGLKSLTIQGANGLSLGDIKSDNLESIEIICGGLSASVIKQVTDAKAPNLKKFNLYLGVEDYGFDGNISDIKELMDKSDFQKLTYLGICNSAIQNEVAEAVLNSKYAGQIAILDMSKGVMTDQGAQIILDNADKLKNLKYLDLEYHYISDEMQEKLKKLPFKVNLEDPQDYDEEEDYYNYPMFTE